MCHCHNVHAFQRLPVKAKCSLISSQPSGSHAALDPHANPSPSPPPPSLSLSLTHIHTLCVSLSISVPSPISDTPSPFSLLPSLSHISCCDLGRRVDAHLPSADSHQQTSRPSFHASVVAVHYGVKVVTSSTRLTGNGLHTVDAFPRPSRLKGTHSSAQPQDNGQTLKATASTV